MLSIIIPCYNEGKILKQNIEKIKIYMDNTNIAYEIFIINDGSEDDTYKIVRQIKGKNINYISYENNKGKGHAVQKGILSCNGNKILFMDADLSTNLSAIERAYNINSDIVIGSRTHNKSVVKNKKLSRIITSKISNIIIKLFTGLNVKDTQCGFKMMSKEVADFIASKQIINRWAFDVEYLYIAKLNNIKIYEMPVVWKDDKNSKVNILKDSFKFIKELFKIRLNRKNYI